MQSFIASILRTLWGAITLTKKEKAHLEEEGIVTLHRHECKAIARKLQVCIPKPEGRK